MDINDIKQVNLNIDTLTIGEIEDVEESLEADFGDILSGAAGIRQGKLTRVLVYVALKRDYPEITMDIVRSLPLDVLSSANVEGDEPVDPT